MRYNGTNKGITPFLIPVNPGTLKFYSFLNHRNFEVCPLHMFSLS